MKTRIIVLNYNGEKYIEQCLPSICEAAQKSVYPVTVSVIDNQSTDRSIEILEKNFPQTTVYKASQNRVLCSYNEYLRQVDEPVVIFLNNDIRVDGDFIDPLVKHFEKNTACFMVAPKVMTFDGAHFEGGKSRSRIKYGIFWHSSRFQGYEAEKDKPGYTMAAGFGAFNKDKFLELGGYDDLYLPGRLEDNDICFRAWRKGWECLYEPKSVVYHVGGKAFHDKFGSQKTLVLGHRNSFLFFWKNIRDFRYVIEHILLLLPRLLFSMFSGKPELTKGFLQAFPFLGGALKRRNAVKHEKSIRKDREIFGLVK